MTTTESDSLGRLYRVLREDSVDEFTHTRFHRRVMASIEASGAGTRAFGLARARWTWASLATAAALLLVFALALHGRSPAPPAGEGVRIVSVQANGGVHLRWADAGKREYRVLRSTDPADFSGAEQVSVRGTEYLDRSPGSSRVVYYRVE